MKKFVAVFCLSALFVLTGCPEGEEDQSTAVAGMPKAGWVIEGLSSDRIPVKFDAMKISDFTPMHSKCDGRGGMDLRYVGDRVTVEVGDQKLSLIQSISQTAGHYFQMVNCSSRSQEIATAYFHYENSDFKGNRRMTVIVDFASKRLNIEVDKRVLASGTITEWY